MNEGIETIELTEKQLHTLRHMLGINKPADRVPKPYRNYAAVAPGNEEYVELARLGVVELYECSNKDYDYYQCTDQGKLLAMRSHRNIRYTRGKRRYRVFLDIRDAFQDLSFREFLTDPEFAQARAEA